jgi:hypothetical protein
MHECVRDGPAASLRAQAEIGTKAGAIEAALSSSPCQICIDGQGQTPWPRWDRPYDRRRARQHRAQTRPEPLVPCITLLHRLSHPPAPGQSPLL